MNAAIGADDGKMFRLQDLIHHAKGAVEDARDDRKRKKAVRDLERYQTQYQQLEKHVNALREGITQLEASSPMEQLSVLPSGRLQIGSGHIERMDVEVRWWIHTLLTLPVRAVDSSVFRWVLMAVLICACQNVCVGNSPDLLILFILSLTDSRCSSARGHPANVDAEREQLGEKLGEEPWYNIHHTRYTASCRGITETWQPKTTPIHLPQYGRSQHVEHTPVDRYSSPPGTNSVHARLCALHTGNRIRPR